MTGCDTGGGRHRGGGRDRRGGLPAAGRGRVRRGLPRPAWPDAAQVAAGPAGRPRLRRRRARRGLGACGRRPDPRRPGRPWLLVNAAGVFSIQYVTDLDEAEWDRILDTNLKGPFLTCREFLPAMIAAHDGCIVNIASTAGVRGGRRRAAYCASKGGLVQPHPQPGDRSRTRRRPGELPLPGADRHRDGRLDPARRGGADRWASRLPAGRIGTRERSPTASPTSPRTTRAYLHGAVLMVDGGGTA